MTTSPETGAQLVRTVVCAYAEELPAAWLQVFRRFERALARARLRVRVRLLPLDDLPESFEVLVVSPEVRERAEALRTGARVVSVTRELAAAAADDLVRELRSGRSIYANEARPNDPKVVTLRGTEEL
jgi:hypothetical protein